MEFPQLTDFSQYQEAIKTLRASGQRVFSNCYLLPEEMRKLIEKGMLSWKVIPHGILLFHETQSFIRLIYFLTKTDLVYETVNFTGFRKAVILDELIKSKDFSVKSIPFEELWIGSGFKIYKRNFRFHRDLPAGDRKALFSLTLDPTRYEHRQIRKDEFFQADQLWRNELDPKSAVFLEEKEMAEHSDTQRVYCICDNEGHIHAAYRMEFKGRTAVFWQVVVEKNHREMEKALDILKMQYLIHPDITRFEFWINEENQKVIKAILKLGYVQDPLINIQYILPPQGVELNG